MRVLKPFACNLSYWIQRHEEQKMTRTKSIISAVLIGFMATSLSASNSSAQVFEENAYKAEFAILSAGSRSAAVSRLKVIPSVGVVNLAFRNTARFRDDVPDVSEFRISAEKNFSGIKKLRAALRANPATRQELARHGIAVNRVVGVDIYSNGSIRLYIL
jgi:hypothetical protein